MQETLMNNDKTETVEERNMMVLLTMQYQRVHRDESNCGICPAEGSFAVMYPEVLEDDEELMRTATELIKTPKEGLELMC